jgi:hypothetical protein
MRMPGSVQTVDESEAVDDSEEQDEEDGFDFALENLTLEQNYEN